MLKWIKMHRMGICLLDEFGVEQGALAGCCEQGTEHMQKQKTNSMGLSPQANYTD
jgi:hypothetical protein